MSREIFQNLLETYHKGLCTDAEKKIVEHWYELLDRKDANLEPEELSFLEQKIWNKINCQISEEEASPFNSKLKLSAQRILAVAAVICLTVSLVILFIQRKQDQNATFLVDKAHALNTLYNEGTTLKIIKLEDGSLVTLEPKASLTFPAHFENGVREVSLDGNAFFLISKNPKRPFLVYNKHIITRVLGTSFSIRVNPKTKQSEVTVKTGKVLVRPNSEQASVKVPALFTKENEVTLIPNQKATYNVAAKEFDTTLADNPVPLPESHSSTKPMLFRFNDTAVKDVIAVLTEAYGIEIILKTDDLKAITFTGDLSAFTLYKKLDFLCESIAAHYHIQGTHIIIKKK
jgi:transmembrane sensor